MEAHEIEAQELEERRAYLRRSTELTEGLVGPPRRIGAGAGDFGRHVWRTMVELPGVGRYSGEILRQASFIITGSTLVIVFMMFLIGTFCGLEGNAALNSYGASSYVGAYTSWCGLREAGPIMFGYIFAAKVGCGIVAEIGSMKTADELDAMDAIGVSSTRFIVCTRLVAVWLVVVPLFLIGIAFEQLANFFVVIGQISQSSLGGFEHVHFSFQDPADLLYATIKAFAEGTAIVLIATFFGVRARGGPVGVGAATAMSMVANLIAIHVISGLLTRVLWSGYSPNAPIGG
jgi:phospholipid/cholesterol/gamma-HCH transport system permease protein